MKKDIKWIIANVFSITIMTFQQLNFLERFFLSKIAHKVRTKTEKISKKNLKGTRVDIMYIDECAEVKNDFFKEVMKKAKNKNPRQLK